MKRTELVSVVGIGMLTLLVLAAAVMAFVPAAQTGSDGDTVPIQGGEQIVQLSYQNLNYYPNTITLKAGVPVKLVVDTDKVVGCMRSIVIPSMGIRKTVTPQDNVITFTPTKEGTIPFSCSMGMGRGTFVVTKDGTANSASTQTIQEANQPVQGGGGSCGSGGCGCGM